MNKREDTALLAGPDAESGVKEPKTLGKVYYYACVIAISSFMFGYVPCITNGALVGDAKHDGSNGVRSESVCRCHRPDDQGVRFECI